MKIYINKYRDHWLSPYTIMEKVLFWKKWTDPTFDLYDDKNDKYTDWLVKPCEMLQKFLDIVHPKINYVKIDKWDTWNMDGTLARIILPMLKQLQATKHGSPLVDDEDVPEHLRSTAAPAKENEWDTDANHFKRWDWVMDELIWTFEQLNPDYDWQEQYYSGKHDTYWEKTEKTYPNPITGKEEATFEMKRGPNDTFKIDSEGMTKHQERITNGLRLFGKYYQGLWD
jgi:hypothetical protein